MSHESEITPIQDELQEDFDALERVERIINNSTFIGHGAKRVSDSLEFLHSIKLAVISKMKEESREDNNEKTTT